MLEINWLRTGIIAVLCIVIAIIWGNSKLARKFADDLVLSLQKAHLGKLPQGQYDGQYVYTKHMSKEQLCVPLDASTLSDMAECEEVLQHEAHFQVATCKCGASRCRVTLNATITFEGRKPDGTPVNVSIRDAQLLAYIDRDKNHCWMLSELAS